MAKNKDEIYEGRMPIKGKRYEQTEDQKKSFEEQKKRMLKKYDEFNTLQIISQNSSNDTFSSEIVSDKYEQVDFTYENGDKYSGPLKNSLREGHATYTWKNGDTYYGEWRENNRNGNGKFHFFSTGDEYDGEWRDDKATGMGIYRWKNGEIFEGSFVDMGLDGEGIRTLTNGEKVKQLWQNNKFISQTNLNSQFQGQANPTPKLQMRQVMAMCRTQPDIKENFSKIYLCIKDTYSNLGSQPESLDVANFYVFLDEIEEKITKKQISISIANAEMIRAYQNTIELANNKKEADMRNLQNDMNNLNNQIELQNSQIQMEAERRQKLMKEAQRLLSPAPSVHCTSQRGLGGSISTNCY
jgi:hypothetical protein